MQSTKKQKYNYCTFSINDVTTFVSKVLDINKMVNLFLDLGISVVNGSTIVAWRHTQSYRINTFVPRIYCHLGRIEFLNLKNSTVTCYFVKVQSPNNLIKKNQKNLQKNILKFLGQYLLGLKYSKFQQVGYLQNKQLL